MADVFISYSQLDKDRVAPIAERLTSLGYSVAWERTPRTDRAFADEIGRALDSARVVLTAWSHNAYNSTWVYAESSRGLDARKLVQLRLDAVQPPLPFDALPIADITGERGEWGPLEDALARIVRDSTPPEPLRKMQPAGLFAAAGAAGSPKILTAALAATLAAYAGGVSATFNDVMSPEQLQIALVGMVGVAGACAALTAHRLFTISRAGG